MQFTPMSETEAKEKSKPGYLLKEGECDFEVKAAVEGVGRESGNPHLKLTLDVYDANGKRASVFDYLTEGMPHKVRHFFYAVGLGHEYETHVDVEPHRLVNKGGRLVIRTKEQKGYDPKNDVADYVIADKTRQGDGYQAAKAARSPNPAADAPAISPRAAAWKAFCLKTPTMQTADRQGAYRTCILAHFGETYDEKAVTADGWKAFEQAIRSRWTAEGGFAEPVAAAIGPDTFTDDDIPF